jgi:transcriptional regulator with XRE-family HTH domain
MDLREILAANLRRLRHEKELSQDDLAYEAEISRSYLSQIEKAKFYASLRIIQKLALVLEVEAAELLWSLEKYPAEPLRRRYPCRYPVRYGPCSAIV